MQSSDAMLARFLALHPKTIDLSLGRIERLLMQLGAPQRQLPPVIHVAGTNGKGSTIAFMRAVLEAAGLVVHVYTSPHLVRFHERIRLGHPGGGRFVDEDRLVEALERCEDANAGAPITVFEITTAAAMLLFAETPADVLLLEVGLGGRLDATNVVDEPQACVVTPVSLDHADYLGNSVMRIAAEKAGIFKRGAPAIIAPQEPETTAVLEAAAERVGARSILVGGQDFHVHEERGRLVYQDAQGLVDLPLPRLAGRHQLINAGTALATLRAAGYGRLPAEAFEAGMTRAEWPARMQRMRQGSLVDLAPEGAELWLDGGHNPDGGRAIAAALADIEERVPRPLVLMAGMLTTKDCSGFLRNFTGLARRLIAVPVPGAEKGMPAEDLSAAARAVGLSATSRDSLDEAFATVGKLDLAPPPRILITGSLYLAGAVLKENGTLPV